MEYLKASDPKAQKLIDQMKIKMLPAYIFSKEVEREPTFAEFKKMSTKIEDQYYAKPEFSGVSFFLGRASEKNKLDVFVVLTAPGMIPSVKIAKEIALNKKNGVNVSFHFLGIEDATTKKLISPGNVREASEEKACACVEKYYPKQSWDYLLERLTKADDIWVEDSLQALRMDVKKIKNCAKGPEGEKLLQEKVRLAKELDIRYAPLFLMGNVEIFGVNEKTTAQEVVQVIKGELKAQ
jgi:hypothetical protein